MAATEPGYLSDLDLADCKTPALRDLLDDSDLLRPGPMIDGSLSDRDRDRIRLARFIASKPEGTPLNHAVSYAVKGVSPESCDRVTGSDADYQFAYRFIHDLADNSPALASLDKQNSVLFVTPELPLIDLIVEGISQTPAENPAGQYDREHCVSRLKALNSVDDRMRDLMTGCLHSYLDRIEDYRLLFDVHFAGTRKADTRRMTKRYKTRFNDGGRIKKQFARFNDALEHGYDNAENAVLVTLTTDPKQFPSLYDAIDDINQNFNRLLSYFDADPETKDDTRRSDVAMWTADLDADVTGRPRDRPEYIKALEFTEAGYPHLHVLFFDVPERDSDGMPWLCDKNELSHKWADYGQGRIVDAYPLTHRDDLDQLPPEFDTGEGFVDWYRWGDHDHSEEWVRNRTNAHDLIEFGDETESAESTAGKYLGKYLSATFGSLIENTESLDEQGEAFADKAATWKLALYWVSGRRFWSCSQNITRAIDTNDHLHDDPAVKQTVRETSIDTLQRLAKPEVSADLARRSWSDLANLDAAIERALIEIETPVVRSTLPDEKPYTVAIDYLGAYALWDLPASAVGPQDIDLETVESQQTDDVLPSVDTDRPPPAVDVWG